MRDIPKFILGNNVNDIPASTKNSCASGEVYKLCPIAVGAPLRNCMLAAVPTQIAHVKGEQEQIK